jgi:hypothetical protein
MGTQVGKVDGDLGVEGYHDLNAIELPQAEPIGLSTVKTSFGVVHWPDVKGNAARKPRGRSFNVLGKHKGTRHTIPKAASNTVVVSESLICPSKRRLDIERRTSGAHKKHCTVLVRHISNHCSKIRKYGIDSETHS